MSFGRGMWECVTEPANISHACMHHHHQPWSDQPPRGSPCQDWTGDDKRRGRALPLSKECLEALIIVSASRDHQEAPPGHKDRTHNPSWRLVSNWPKCVFTRRIWLSSALFEPPIDARFKLCLAASVPTPWPPKSQVLLRKPHQVVVFDGTAISLTSRLLVATVTPDIDPKRTDW